MARQDRLILSRNGWCPFGKWEDKLLGVSSPRSRVVAEAVPVANEKCGGGFREGDPLRFVMDPRGSQPVILLGPHEEFL